MGFIAPTRIPPFYRPIRIPDTVSIQKAEPVAIQAGERAALRLPLVISRDVPPDATLKLQLWGGRSNKGVFNDVQVRDPAEAGFLSVSLQDGTALGLEPDNRGGTFVIQMPASGLTAGIRLTVVLGDPSDDSRGIRAQNHQLLDKFIVLYAVPEVEDPSAIPNWAGGSVWADPSDKQIIAACTMHIVGGPLHHLRAYAPASAETNNPFAIVVRPEDQYGNLSPVFLDGLTVRMGGHALTVDATEVADSSCMRLQLTVPEAGIQRLQIEYPDSKLDCWTNPVVISDAPPAQKALWGMIHGHTEMSDGTGSVERYFKQLRDEVALDFAALGDHDHSWETPDAYWSVTCDAVKRWNAPGQFVTFLGYEWAKWRQNGDGDRNVYFLHDDRPIYRSDDGLFPHPPDLFEALRTNQEQAMVIPHHPGHRGNFCDWKDHSPEHERLVEIFQLRGSYECAPEDGNPVPEGPGNPPVVADGYVRRALALGWRVGFTAGGDDHSGLWGTEAVFHHGGADYKQGLMSVFAEACTREAIWDALMQRRVVATTGPRILLNYTVNGQALGSELSCTTTPELARQRTLQLIFHGTAALERLDIIRSNEVVHSINGDGRLDVEDVWVDNQPLADVCLPPAKFCDHPFAFYYVRALQTDGEVAWASPTWIDSQA